jgi:putative methionine-R-sulfoxide reductase with GAF domain
LRASDGFVIKKIGSEKKDTPVLNEELLGKLLEAAYVLQEHNRHNRGMDLGVELDERKREAEAAAAEASAAQTAPVTEAASPSSFAAASITAPSITPPSITPAPVEEQASSPDYTATLAQIVETQHKIQLRNLKLEEAMTLVAERVREITRAAGAAIATANGKRIRYRAAAGAMALPVGTEVSLEKALCSACIRTGQVVRGADINAAFLLDSSECQRRGIQSMIAVPVYHEGGIGGGLELYYAGRQAFTEQDVHTCQLMAGLVTEALARDEEITWKQSLASERAVVLEALEKLDPTIAAALEDAPTGKTAGTKIAGTKTPAFTCRRCGHQLVGEEKFCGKCGTARPAESRSVEPHSVEPRSVEARQTELRPEVHPGQSLADSIAQQNPELFTASSSAPTELSGAMVRRPIEITDHSHQPLDLEADGAPTEADDGVVETALAPAEPAADWSSAATARAFLQQLAAGKPDAFAGFWRARRGDIYLAVAGILVAVVIGWAIFSDHSVGAAANAAAAGHRKAPDADLSVLDRMLINLGLAEAPEPPETKGNPDTQVWVDLHTALYYCPGADLYGKTPKGKFTSQRDAQLDQFEPAYRKACE